MISSQSTVGRSHRGTFRACCCSLLFIHLRVTGRRGCTSRGRDYFEFHFGGAHRGKSGSFECGVFLDHKPHYITHIWFVIAVCCPQLKFDEYGAVSLTQADLIGHTMHLPNLCGMSKLEGLESVHLQFVLYNNAVIVNGTVCQGSDILWNGRHLQSAN